MIMQNYGWKEMVSSKTKTAFVCEECGEQFIQWTGKCTSCGAWSSLKEITIAKGSTKKQTKTTVTASYLSEVKTAAEDRIGTGISELDHVLGGGLVSDSVVLLGGDPGIGKSTLLLQALASLSQDNATLYITGEESLNQVAMRAKRLGVDAATCRLLAETNLETILTTAKNLKPDVLVIDSIQTICSEELAAQAGSVSQVRYCADQLVAYAKHNRVAIILVGHVTKEGSLAGPRVLEHMVDCVLYFESQNDNRFRALRAVKNRFGAVNELGVFAMTDQGLRTVANPSAIFLSNQQSNVAGRVVMVTWEGTRPLLIEVQALVDSTHLPQARRLTVGVDHNRLNMLLAVLNKHAGIVTYDQDVFLNAVGGVKLAETGADVAIITAVLSSLRDKVLPMDRVVFGEVGLTGEIRPVPGGEMRLKEAGRLGFTSAIVPTANAPKQKIPGMHVTAVETVAELVQALY